MTNNKQPTTITKFCALSLGVFCLCSFPACAQTNPTVPQQEQQQLNQQGILEELAKADVVYLGETHDSELDHEAQLEILQALYQDNQKIALGMEMFQRPFQEKIDQYLAGEITEAELIEQTEYEQRWGFPWEYYAPLLRFAKANKLPVLALNTPSEITRKVARQGLASLTTAEQQYIPPLSEIHTDNVGYRKMVQEVYQAHAHAGHGNSDGFERFFTAQVLWDETMAQKIAQFYQDNSGYQVVVIAGRGHIVYGYGIPSRVSRRIEDEEFVQRSVLFRSVADELSDVGEGIADYFWEH
ncbi:MAG: ChaN family lipoprotein [Symploca sp. SIO2E6]|nr:ChaN family lipoprotein [Symploca sp. SIO2E6]